MHNVNFRPLLLAGIGILIALIALLLAIHGGIVSNPSGLMLALAAALMILGTGFILWRRIVRMLTLLEQSRDQSERINRRLEMRESQERAIRENVLDAIITINDKGIIRSWNRAAETIFGYRPEEAIGRNVALIVAEPHKHRHDEYLRHYLETGQAHIIGIGREVEGQRKDGTRLPLYLGVTEVELGGEPTFIGILRDIRQQKEHEAQLEQAKAQLEERVRARTRELEKANRDLRAEVAEHEHTQEQLRRLANYDPLTDLPNRALYTDHLHISLAQAQRRGQEVALLFIDLDEFKFINDTCGHSVGDAVLRQAAERLVSTLREEDMVARIGGDEFTVILGPTGDIEPMARTVAAKILEQFARPFQVDDQAHRLGASIGVSLYPADGTDSESMQSHADQAMYAAKHGGRNRCHFYRS